MILNSHQMSPNILVDVSSYMQTDLGLLYKLNYFKLFDGFSFLEALAGIWILSSRY